MPQDKIKAALDGLKGASPDAQIAERTKINQAMSGAPDTREGFWDKQARLARFKQEIDARDSRPGIKGPQRTTDVHLPMPFDELMARAKAIK